MVKMSREGDVMDALEKAISMAESSIEATSLEGYVARVNAAQAYATIALAKQTKRLADAAERRNELLVEYNKASEQSAKAHTEKIEAGISKFVDALYGESE